MFSSLERLRSKFFWGAEQHSNKLIMIKWENALASFEKGGLGFGSLKAFNLALLQKWRWRLSHPITSGRCLDMIHDLEDELHSLSLSTDRDALLWGLTHDGSFTVGATRKHINDVILPTLSVETSWCNILPRKVNILIWRMRLDRLPHRLNLSRRGLDIHSIDCPILDIPSLYSHSDWESWFDNIQ
ncbi:hypothetical protein Tco_1535563, partial [Tanacetum coccineum]